MRAETYPFVAKPLPYEYDSLSPVLDAKTLHYHHDRHYAAYVEKLNGILAEYPQLQQMNLEDLLANPGALPKAAKQAILNNGGGVYNHEMYFNSMKCPTGQVPCGILADAIQRDFGSISQWKEQMKQAALSVFGSGWAWMVVDEAGNLQILTTANQEVPDLTTYKPVLPLDVWEHAYYLPYQNLRGSYVDGWFSLIHWKKVERIYESVVLSDREREIYEQKKLSKGIG